MYTEETILNNLLHELEYPIIRSWCSLSPLPLLPLKLLTDGSHDLQLLRVTGVVLRTQLALM